jgi:NAD(P)-dependent dehydrogenase (short-subunit alcohol dehydrogenase family)
MPAARKVVLVTGASSGIGKQIALRLGADGHRVFGTSRTPRPEGASCTMLQLDVTDDASVCACVEQTIEEAGRIDVLVNNAGFGLFGAIEDTTVAEAKAQFETNFWGVVRVTKAALAHMRRQGSGRVITVGSMAGHVGLPFQAYYAASKHALEAFNESLRLELHGSGIDSTIICPGDFRTGFTRSRKFAGRAKLHIEPDRVDGFLKIYERDEMNGADATLVSDLVSTIVHRQQVDVRYFTGKASQRASMVLKRMLSARVFESLFRSTYQLK